MANAARDENQVTAFLGTSNADGSTRLRSWVNPTTHALLMEDGVDGADLSSDDIARRDENGIAVWLAASSTDGVTPVAVYINAANNRLLVKST